MKNPWLYIIVLTVAFWTAFFGMLFNCTIQPSNAQKLDVIVENLVNEDVR